MECMKGFLSFTIQNLLENSNKIKKTLKNKYFLLQSKFPDK